MRLHSETGYLKLNCSLFCDALYYSCININNGSDLHSVCKRPATCSVTPHPFSHISLLAFLNVSVSLSNAFTMAVNYSSFPWQSPCFKGRCESLPYKNPKLTWVAPQLSSFSLPFFFPISEGNIYLILNTIHSFFSCIHFFHSTLLFGPWSWYRCCWVVSNGRRPFPWRIYRVIWLARPGWWLQVSVRTAWSEERVPELRQE